MLKPPREDHNILKNFTKQRTVTSINTRNTTPIKINDMSVGSVEDFNYIGSINSKDSGTEKEILAKQDHCMYVQHLQSYRSETCRV